MEEACNTDEEDDDKWIPDFSPNSGTDDCSLLLSFLSKFNRVH